MSIPKDLSTLEQMQNMKNMIGDGFIEFLKPSIKSHQNENVLKMLDLAKEKPESCIELLSVAIFHHNIPVIKHIIEKLNLTENESPYINALNFHNSIFPDNSPYKLTEAKEAFIDVQIPFILMAGISGHIDIFEYLMNQKLIINKKISGVIGLSKKNKNLLYSNVIGACAFYGKYKLLEFILKNYKDELDIGFITNEKKAKNNIKINLLKEYTGCTPALLAVVGLAEDKDTLEVLKILKQYNAKFDNSNVNKDNILHLAIKNKKLECAKYICEELGLKNLLNDSNKDGYNPLSLAQHLEEENFITYFHSINEDYEKKMEENWKELLAESDKKETKKGKKKKGKKKGKNNDIENDIPGYLASSDYQETLKEIVPKKTDDENNKNKLHELLETPSTKKGKKKKSNQNENITNNKKEKTEEEYEEEFIGDSKEKEDIKEKSNPTPEEDDDVIIGLNFKNNKKNKKLKQVDKSRSTLNNNKKEKEREKEKTIPNEEPKLEPEINNNNTQIETIPEKNPEIKKEEEIKEERKIPEQSEEVKKEKKTKPKKTKKEKRKDKESTDDFIEQMRKREKEKQELKRLEEEKKRKEQEEKEQKEREEQQRLLEEERIKKEQEEKQRLEELKKLEEEKLRQEEENRKKEEEEEKSDKESLSLSDEENNNNNNVNISEEKEEEKEATVSMEEYERLNKNYLDLEKRLSILEQEKTQLTTCLTKLYLENKSKAESAPNQNEENINDLMYLANKELANKNEIISDLENKLTMLDLTNIKNFSVEKLKKFKEFYDKNLQIINDAMK